MNIPSTVSKGLGSKNLSNSSNSNTNGVFFKMNAGESKKMIFLRPCKELWEIEQVFRWFGKIGTGWIYEGPNDPFHFLDEKGMNKNYRCVIPVLVQNEDTREWEGPFVWLQSKKTADKLVASEEATEMPLSAQVYVVKRIGESMNDTEYFPTPTGKLAKSEVDFSDYEDFQEIQYLLHEDGAIKYLEDKLKMDFETILSKYGNGKKPGPVLEDDDLDKLFEDDEEYEEV